MEIDKEIVQWVNNIKSVIKAKTDVYALFAPYECESACNNDPPIA